MDTAILLRTMVGAAGLPSTPAMNTPVPAAVAMGTARRGQTQCPTKVNGERSDMPAPGAPVKACHCG